MPAINLSGNGTADAYIVRDFWLTLATVRAGTFTFRRFLCDLHIERSALDPDTLSGSLPPRRARRMSQCARAMNKTMVLCKISDS